MKRNWLLSSKLIWGIWRILIEALKNLNLHFTWLPLTKVYVWAKKYRGVTFDSNEHWYKIWRKTDFCFQKWHEEFGKFSPEHLKVSKLELWWDSFIQSRKSMSLKFTGEISVMTMKKDAKLEEELTCCVKIYMRTFMNFDRRTWKSQNFVL